MKHDNVNRRDFSKWTMAAFGGFMSGAVIGCNGSESGTAADTAGDSSGGEETSQIPPHGCRGLNECKTASNDCRGQGSCATEGWHHSCHQQNDCKGQGGCGENPLQNACEGKGACQIPLMEPAWETARENMEKKWDAAGKEYGDPPPVKS